MNRFVYRNNIVYKSIHLQRDGLLWLCMLYMYIYIATRSVHMDESTLFSCNINDGDDAVDAPGDRYGDDLSPYDLQ